MNKLNVIINYMYALLNTVLFSAWGWIYIPFGGINEERDDKISFIGCALYVKLFYQEKSIAFEQEYYV